MAISPPAAAPALAVVLAALCLLVAPAAGFYLPGVAPNDFDKVLPYHFLPTSTRPSSFWPDLGYRAQIWARADGFLRDLPIGGATWLD